MSKLKQLLRIIVWSLFALMGLLLVVFSLPKTGWRALSVQTGSMVPTYKIGSLVLVHRIPASNLKIGDVITYASLNKPGETITHRITAIIPSTLGPARFVVKGDANPAPDPVVNQSQIVGQVRYGIPYFGRLVDWVRSPIGLALLIYLPALMVIIQETRLMIKRLMDLEQAAHPERPPNTAPAILTELIVPPAGLPTRQLVDGLRPVTLISTPSIAKDTAQLEAKPILPRRPVYTTLSIMMVLLLGSNFGLQSTFAALNSNQASLTNNSISGQLPSPSPSVSPSPTSSPRPVRINHVVLSDVEFGCNVDNLGSASRRPKIVIYNPTRRKIVIGGWTIEDNSGVIFELPKLLVLNPHDDFVVLPFLPATGNHGLQYAGDRLIIRDDKGVIVDGLSWGLDRSVLNPAVPAISPGNKLRRSPKKSDKDSAADWINNQRRCRSNSQADNDPDHGPVDEGNSDWRIQPGQIRGWEDNR